MICRVCDCEQTELVLDLGMQPWCNNFLRAEEVGREPVYPLRLVYCRRCATPQLDYTVPKEIMFGDHTYLSGLTRSLGEHFRRVAEEVERRVRASGGERTVLDIGSNDGTQLTHYQALGYDALGVEPARTVAEIARARGVPTVGAFFDLQFARSLGRKFRVINAAGVFFHLEELHSAAEGIRAALADDGVFVVQFLYMKRIVENLAFDQIYHEHLLYYNLANLETLLARHGMELFDCYLSPIHGGSMIALAAHRGRQVHSPRLEAALAAEHDSGANRIETYQRFARQIAGLRQRNLAFLDEARSQGKEIFGLGAPAKGNTLLNYFKIGPDRLACLVEINRLRRGLFSPGMHLPVVMEDELDREPDVYYVLAWNFKREILQKKRHLLDRGVQFYFPVDAEGS